MENLCSNITAIVVGNKKQTLVAEAATCLDRINIPYKLCEDIYSAVVMIVTAPADNLLVIGCFTALTAENMRLFSLAPKGKKVSFCCILKKCSDHLQPKAMAAAQAGVFVINDAEHIEIIIKQCRNTEVAVAKPKTGGRDFASRITSLADNFFLTQAEQDALLGVSHNAATKNIAIT